MRVLIDNGSKHARALAKLAKVEKTVELGKVVASLFAAEDLLILSGGHHHSVLHHPKDYQAEIDLVRHHPGPIIGVCLGAEIIAYAFGAKLEPLPRRERGTRLLELPVSLGGSEIEVYESHRWGINNLPPELQELARSESGVEIFRHRTRPIYGLQFHPESTESGDGARIFNLLLQKYTED